MRSPSRSRRSVPSRPRLHSGRARACPARKLLLPRAQDGRAAYMSASDESGSGWSLSQDSRTGTAKHSQLRSDTGRFQTATAPQPAVPGRAGAGGNDGAQRRLQSG